MISPEGWAALGRPTPADARAFAARLFPEADVVLIEGGKGVAGIPKIEVLRAGVAVALTCRPEELLAVVSDGPLPGVVPVPVFGPEETARLSDLILSVEEASMADITLKVDGREVNLNPFVRTFIERTVLGMITSLSGVDPDPKRISLVIDRTEGRTTRGPKP
jgi:hypothetical protein